MQRNRHRPVVNQCHLHVGPETPGLHVALDGACLSHKVVDQPFAFFGRRGAAETRPVASGSVGSQRELAHHQQRAAALRTSVEQALMSAVPGLRATIQLLPSDVEAHFDDARDLI